MIVRASKDLWTNICLVEMIRIWENKNGDEPYEIHFGYSGNWVKVKAFKTFEDAEKWVNQITQIQKEN